MLDYNIDNTADRLVYVAQLDLANLSPAQLQSVATYLLRHALPRPPLSPTLPLDSIAHYPADAAIPIFSHPRNKLDWANPLLASRNQLISYLKETMQTQAPYDAHRTRQLIRDLQIEAGYELAKEPMPYSPPIFASPIDLEPLVDLTNPFHIKQIVKNYSRLRQSPHTLEWMWDVEQVMDAAPLLPWERHILVRSIDGANQISIGVELAQQYGRNISPSYLSQTKRRIYTKIANEAKKQQEKKKTKSKKH